MSSAECGAQETNAALQTSWQQIQARIQTACARVGRDATAVTVMAVSKTVPAEIIRTAIQAGAVVFGENRVQEAEAKIAALADLRPSIQWHLIGHLQSNKARKAVALFDAVQSIDSLDVAQRLDRVAAEQGKKLPVFMEINLGGETSKAGTTATAALPLLEKIGKLPNLILRGLMTVPPYFDDPEQVRPYFRQLRNLRAEALATGIVDVTAQELSMGMSHDFAIAIEEGATLVRIGTALFGARNYHV